MCNRVIWMEHGVARMEGPADEVVDAYVASVTGQDAPHVGARAAA